MRPRLVGGHLCIMYICISTVVFVWGGGLHKTPPKKGGVDFHPLLQRFEASNYYVANCSFVAVNTLHLTCSYVAVNR